MQVVHGIERLSAEHGPVFVAIGVFDGLHIGHHYLLRHLVTVAEARSARPTVITFDHHPDEILTGHAPPLLLDPTERLARLEEAGVAATVVQHFDLALRETTYVAFVERIRHRVELRGFLMTPDAAFGYERRGTPEALARLGEELGFEVVVVPPFTLDGRTVRSSEIRVEIAAGNLASAAALLGRPVTLTGIVAGAMLSFELPVALPPDGRYAVRIGSADRTIEIRGGGVHIGGVQASGRVALEFVSD